MSEEEPQIMDTTTFKYSAFQEEWLRALESGEWLQCRGVLKNQDRYCCLGVAAKLAGVDPVLLITHSVLENELAFVAERLGLRNRYGDPAEGDIGWSLVQMNDMKKLTFAQIAERVRANPERWLRETAE